MMGTTHAAVGLVLALPVLVLAPELAPAAALGAVAGGIFPDFDLLVGYHRKTLHFPHYYWVVAVPALLLAAVVPRPLTAAAALFLVAAAVHSGTDWFGAGVEPRPWERTSPEAVFVHTRGEWLRPRYWVRYDGAPEDLALTAVLSAPGLFAFGRLVRRVTVAMLLVALAYTLVRKRLPALEEKFI
ncbi:metal-dependent hydrolase [Haloplanus sp. GCM10025708]|uniref:metal-dependent hydrolase n=1 Tax=Haloferacaceae TaxID=1644056 RepID=UPI00360933F7